MIVKDEVGEIPPRQTVLKIVSLGRFVQIESMQKPCTLPSLLVSETQVYTQERVECICNYIGNVYTLNLGALYYFDQQ